MDLDAILSDFVETAPATAETQKTEVAEPETKDAEVESDAGQADDETKAEPEQEKTEAEKDRHERRVDRRVAKAKLEAAEANDRAERLEAQLREFSPKERTADVPDIASQAKDLVQHERISTRCDDIFAAGSKAFKDFVPMLQEVAAEVPLFEGHPYLKAKDGSGRVIPAPVPTEAMRAILETEDPHKTLHYLGMNPEDAAELAGKSGVALGRAMARLEDKMGTHKTTVSSAPSPIRSPNGGGKGKGASSADSLSPSDLLKAARA